MIQMNITQDGMSLLRNEIKNEIYYGAFYSTDNVLVVKYRFSNVYYDSEGRITAELLIPLSENYETPVEIFRILNFSEEIVAESVIPQTTFVSGVGGKHVIKLLVDEINDTSKAGDIIYSENDYLTEAEFIAKILPEISAEVLKQADVIAEKINTKGMPIPDFDSGWFTAYQRNNTIANTLGQDAFFLGFQKFPNGEVVQFGVFSSYEDDDDRSQGSGMYLIIREADLVVATYRHNNNEAGYIAGFVDGMSYYLPGSSSIPVRILGWKIPTQL